MGAFWKVCECGQLYMWFSTNPYTLARAAKCDGCWNKYFWEINVMSEEMVKNFWNEEASRWSLQNKNPLVGWYEQHNADPQERSLLFRNIDDSVPLGKLVALEYGCGPGRNLIKFNELFSRIDGADVSEEILAKLPENLAHENLTPGNLYLTNGHSLPDVPSNTYDVVFSIICMQHIGCRSWRLELYSEFMRILKAGGMFTFQMGYGPGHPISVDYFHEYDHTDDKHRDTRVESVEALQKDLEDAGFVNFDHVITDPCHDVHPQWIWVTVEKPSGVGPTTGCGQSVG